LSHGYCEFHHRAAMHEAQKYIALLDRIEPVTMEAHAA